MVGFLIRRLGGLLLTLIVASLAIYGAVAIAPGDPTVLLAGGTHPNPAVVASIRAEFHLNDPFLVQYWHWVTGAIHGDFGRSIAYRSNVSELLSSRLINSLFLVAYGSVLILVPGIALGLLAALKGKTANGIVTMVTTVGMGSPAFVVAIFLTWLFSTQLGWLPVFGSGTGFVGRLDHLTLPAISLAIAYMAYVARITRAAISAELHSEHVDTARARGIPPRQLIRRHVLRNASAPIFAVSGLTIAGLFAGTAVAEQAFGVDGVGSLLIQSATRQDLPVVMAIGMIMVAAFVVISTVVDVINVVLDPRLARTRAA